MIPPAMSRDRSVAIAIFAVTLLIFGYFFQGDGWTMQGNWLTIRAIVEQHTFEITPLADRTGDTAVRAGHIYSNKPPGLPLIGVAPYWAAFHLERWAGLEPMSSALEWMHIRAMTFLLAAVPGAALAALIFIALRRQDCSRSLAAAMSFAFAFGSISWPYSGMLYNHLLVAACCFAAWLLLQSESNRSRKVLLASLPLGGAILSEYLIGPVALAMIVFDLLERRSWRRTILLLTGPLLASAAMLTYQHAVFGTAFLPSYAYETRDIAAADVVRDRFEPPDSRRLYWLTFHRFRGLFYCSPMYIAALLSLLDRRGWRVSHAMAFAISVIAYHLMFLLTYRFWTGGSGVGPRFAIPALPFLFCFAVRGFKRFPLIVWPLVLLSMFNMLAVTAVQANYPANEAGPPQQWDPIDVCTLWLFSGRIAVTPHSSNLGQLIGLRGAASVLPVVAMIAGALLTCLLFGWRERRKNRARV